VDHGDRSFLFTGDMERLAETDLIESGANVDVDVLKVGHHGSYSSTSYRFLREVMPAYAVISVGRNNDYGHPHADPLSRLRDAEVTIYRTDEMYTIVATSDGTNIRFAWENQSAQPWVPAAA
jgi:competence protein ComEC